MQKSVSFLYTNNGLSEREIKKIIPFIIASKRIKYLGIYLTKEVKDLYSKNCETLMKETEDNTNKWKDILRSWRGRIITVKLLVLPKAIYRFSAILIKIWMFFHGTDNSKICMDPQKTPNSQSNLKINKAGGITLPDIKL